MTLCDFHLFSLIKIFTSLKAVNEFFMHMIFLIRPSMFFISKPCGASLFSNFHENLHPNKNPFSAFKPSRCHNAHNTCFFSLKIFLGHFSVSVSVSIFCNFFHCMFLKAVNLTCVKFIVHFSLLFLSFLNFKLLKCVNLEVTVDN